MKKLLVIICTLFLSCSQNTQDTYNCEGAQSWDYPVKPGMEEWTQFQSNDEMVSACQIPENLFFCLSTDDLTDLCLQYPLLSDIFALNLLDDGLDGLFINFNGIRELFKRTDKVSSLTKRYIEMIQSFPSFEEQISKPYNEAINAILEENENLNEVFWEPIKGLAFEYGKFIIPMVSLHALLSRVERQNNESIDNLKEILRALVIGYETISMSVYDYRNLLELNYFARVHIIIKICEQCLEEIPRGKGNAVFSPHGVDIETADIINKLSYQLIK